VCSGPAAGTAAEKHVAVDRFVPAGHGVSREALHHMTAAGGRIDLVKPVQRPDQTVHVLGDEPGAARHDQFVHGSASQRYHRRAAGHRLDHDHPERFFPLDREQEAPGASEQPPLLVGVRFPVQHILVGEAGTYFALEVGLFDWFGTLSGEDEWQADRVGRLQCEVWCLVGMESTKEEGVIVLF
jgi:hypothetical protein